MLTEIFNTGAPVAGHVEGYYCWAMSHRGLVRADNEDTFGVSAHSDTNGQWEGAIPAHEGWAIIADGMGGHAAGQIASRLAVECLRGVANTLGDEEGIEKALAAIHGTMFSAMRENDALSGMGTTVAGVILRADDALCFNVGDSRIYHMGSHLSLISEDHVIDGHVLTRCIGGTSELDLPEPFLLRIMWKKGQRLLICTDGLTDMLDDTEIAAIMDQERRSPAEALITAALNAGGKDNVTVVVLERLG